MYKVAKLSFQKQERKNNFVVPFYSSDKEDETSEYLGNPFPVGE